MKKILIVEDQVEIRELIRVTLEFEPYEIYEAGDGSTGLSMAQKLKPNLMLLDVMMPGGIDGIQVCQHIKSDPELKRTKVVMLSAKGGTADMRAGNQAGADQYLTKPFSPLELISVINKVIR